MLSNIRIIETRVNWLFKKLNMSTTSIYFITKVIPLSNYGEILNSTFSLTKNKVRTSVSKITVNDITYTAQKDICNCLNDYFCDVGKNLASGIPYQLHDFTKYCHVPNNNSMFCTAASTAEILQIISSFKDNKAPGPDNVAPKLLKLISTDVIEPLAYIFNLSFSSGQVPLSL